MLGIGDNKENALVSRIPQKTKKVDVKLMKLFKRWHKKSITKRLLWNLEIRADMLRQKYLLSWAFSYWKTEKLKLRELVKPAKQAHELNLARRIFGSWRREAVISDELNGSTSSAKFERWLEAEYFSNWLETIRERRLHRQQSENAELYRELRLRFLSLLQWRALYLQRFRRRQRILFADLFYQGLQKKRALASFKEYTSHVKAKKGLKLLADEFRTNVLLSKYFYAWKFIGDSEKFRLVECEQLVTGLVNQRLLKETWINMRYAYERVEMLHIAYDQYESDLRLSKLRDFLIIWFDRYDLNLVNEKAARDLAAMNSKRFGLMKWYEHAVEIKDYRFCLGHKASHFWKLKQASRALDIWKHVYDRINKLFGVSSFTRKQRAMKSVFLTWKGFSAKTRELQFLCDTWLQHKESFSTQSKLREWMLKSLIRRYKRRQDLLVSSRALTAMRDVFAVRELEHCSDLLRLSQLYIRINRQFLKRRLNETLALFDRISFMDDELDLESIERKIQRWIREKKELRSNQLILQALVSEHRPANVCSLVRRNFSEILLKEKIRYQHAAIPIREKEASFAVSLIERIKTKRN